LQAPIIRKKSLNKTSKAHICDLYEGGNLNMQAIADRFHVNRATASRIIKRYKQTGVFERKPGSGRQSKLSATDKRQVVISAKRNRRSTLHQIGIDSGLPDVSRSTLSRVLRDSREIVGALTQQKPGMTLLPSSKSI
jgi:transposase